MLNSREFGDLLMFFPVLRELPETLRAAVQSEGQSLTASAHQPLFEAGSTCQGLLLLTAGFLRLIRLTNGGRTFLLFRVAPGDLCVVAACCILGHATYPVSGIAERDVAGVVLPPDLFIRLVEQSPAFRTVVFQRFAECLGKLVRLIDDVASRKLDERLASLLLTKGYPIRLTHQMLADELGTTREVVSRALKQLEAKGLVNLGRGSIYVANKEALARFGRYP